MAGVKICGLSKQYTIGGQSFLALDNINLTIKDGSFVAVVGKSGCGKTTLLRLLCGLEERTAGELHYTREINDSAPNSSRSSRVGIVFQEPRLMPWLTVQENIAFPLLQDKQHKKSKEDKQKLVDKYIRMLGLENFKHAYPSQISGGMAQRTSLGRTLCFDPDLILMDEPFGALDYFTRKNLQNEMVNLFFNYNKTMVFVTHNVEEAVYLSQKVIVLNTGRVAGEFEVDLPYPRQTTSPAFLNIREKIYAAIMGVNQAEVG